jgi:hypothetical protein
MDYNSQREKLLLPEYGRNIQQMIQYTVHIADRDERNRAAQTIVNVMAQTIPNSKELEDYTHKLWDHLFIISNYQLDVDAPYPMPDPAQIEAKPEKLIYPQKPIRYRHYGKNIEYFIEKAKQMENPEMQDKYVEVLANLMKRSYLNWNRDSVNDDLIKEHLLELSDGDLQFKESHRMSSTNEILGLNKQKSFQQQSNQRQGGGGQQKQGFHKKNNNFGGGQNRKKFGSNPGFKKPKY